MIKRASFKSLGQNRSTTFMILLSLILVFCSFYISTFYLAFNETRVGYQLYDPIIASIPAIDLSRIIFACTYSSIIVGLICCMTTPEKIVRVNLSIFCLLIFRILAMFFVPLEPPESIIPLEDEFLLHTTYGEKVLLKDLFFSGHTASVAILFFLIDHKYMRWLLLIMSMVIGTMLIVQHVHYTIDVVAAYGFAFLAFRSGQWLADKFLVYSRFVVLYPARSLWAK